MKKNNRIIISFFVFVLILATVLGKGVPVFAEENEVPVITEENADTKIVATISTPNGEKEFFSGEPFSVSLGIISGKSAVSYNKAELVFEFPDPEGMNMINSWPPADTMKLKSLSYTGEGKDRTRTATYVIENLFGGYTGDYKYHN